MLIQLHMHEERFYHISLSVLFMQFYAFMYLAVVSNHRMGYPGQVISFVSHAY